MTLLARLWRKFLAPFETMQHAHYDAPWATRVRFVHRLSSPHR